MSNKPSMLIADDEEHIRKLLEVIVTSQGYPVVAQARDGGEAVAKYKLTSPDIIFLDINMPKMNGIEALQEIMKANPSAFVIMLTAQNTLDSVQKCIEKGAKQYLLKDNPMDKLAAMITETVTQYVKQL